MKRPAPKRRSAESDRKGAVGDTRRERILEAAALHFHKTGYEAASIRDIAEMSGILAGSLYYHFESKEELFLAVYEEGITRLQNVVTLAGQIGDQPWDRLESACVMHTKMMLSGDHFVQILDYEFPHRHSKSVRKMMVPLRDKYESLFRDLVDALPVDDGVDKKLLRLTLLGALAWSLIWYRPGQSEPENIAKDMIRLIRQGAYVASAGVTKAPTKPKSRRTRSKTTAPG